MSHKKVADNYTKLLSVRIPPQLETALDTMAGSRRGRSAVARRLLCAAVTRQLRLKTEETKKAG